MLQVLVTVCNNSKGVSRYLLAVFFGWCGIAFLGGRLRARKRSHVSVEGGISRDTFWSRSEEAVDLFVFTPCSLWCTVL